MCLMDEIFVVSLFNAPWQIPHGRELLEHPTLFTPLSNSLSY